MKFKNALAYSLLASTFISSKGYSSYLEEGPKVSVTITEPVASDLGKLLLGQEQGVYNLTKTGLRRTLAQNYVPAVGEPSVIDLINRYQIKGDYKAYIEAIKKLSDRGNPAAWYVYGTYLAQNNMASQNEEYHKGMHLLARANEAGVTGAANNLGMMLWYENKLDEAAIAFKSNTSDPHDAVNCGLVMQDQKEPAEKFVKYLMKGTEGGDSSGATSLAQYYSGIGYLAEALKWYLISYKGPYAMDPFTGFEAMIDFMSQTPFSRDEVEKAHLDADLWLGSHPQIYMDGFDMIRLGVSLSGAVYDPEQNCIKAGSVQDCFWNYYALGDTTTFSASLVPFLARKDANALFMKAHLDRGFVGEPDDEHRRAMLEEAVKKFHPLAFQSLAMDLWIEASLENVPSVQKKLYARAYNLLEECYDRYSNSQYLDVIGEVIFLLGYFNEKGIGTKIDLEAAAGYFNEAFPLTPLAAGYLGRTHKDPVTSGAFLLLARSSYTSGDWFGGVHHWQVKYAALSQKQRIAAQKLADKLLEFHPILKRNIYQRLAAGLNPDFANTK